MERRVIWSVVRMIDRYVEKKEGRDDDYQGEGSMDTLTNKITSLEMVIRRLSLLVVVLT